MNAGPHARCPLRSAIAISLSLATLGACRPTDLGGGPAPTTQPSAGRSVTSAPFAEDEFWILASDTTAGVPGLSYLTMNGQGNLVSSIEVLTDPLTAAGCSIQAPEPGIEDGLSDSSGPSPIDFEFDGTVMKVNATSPGNESTGSCSVEFTALVAAPGVEQALFGFNVFNVSIQGDALISGQVVRFAPMQLNRLRTTQPIPCDPPPTSLVGFSWTITNVKPSALVPTSPPADAPVVTIFGSDEMVSSADLHRAGLIGCFASEGAVRFDGTNLAFELVFSPLEPFPIDPGCNDTCEFAFNGQCDDLAASEIANGTCSAGTDCADCGPLAFQPTIPRVPLDGDGDGAPMTAMEEPRSCSIMFSGQVAECGVFLPPVLGTSPAALVLRIEGTGSFADTEDAGELTTLYISINKGPGGFCGAAMIPTLPLILLGLYGLRFRSRRH